MSEESEEARRAQLLAELDQQIRKREAKRFAHTELMGKIFSNIGLCLLGFVVGIGVIYHFANLIK